MHLSVVYVVRNLTRNRRRTALTCAAVGLPIMIFVLSTAVIDGIGAFLDNSGKQLRLVVMNHGSVVNPLPSGYRSKIESLDPTGSRILSVCGMRWIGGQVQNDPRPLSTLAVDADTFVATFPDQQLTPEEIEQWNRSRQSILVGAATAAAFGWKTGDRITIRSSIPPYVSMEFRVVSTASRPGKDPVTIFCRRDYLEEAMKSAVFPEGWNLTGSVSFFFVRCTSMADLDYFRVAIDELFARSLDRTKTQDEKTFMNAFITQFLDMPNNLTRLAAVTIIVAVIAATNTMSMNLRDRLSEIAVLKSIGFSAPILFAFIQAESLFLCLLGGLIGALVPFIGFGYTPLKEVSVPLIQHIEISLGVCVKAQFMALAVGVLAAAWPAWSASHAKVVAALRKLN
ncbi:MAG: ABC transporter permease [Planctomycetes bacterium]|nr:ABC transporter permease [Planctomycetota bacterium]MBI3832903.1 ABC transporter permease [Planctomycetota bacterium]